MVGVACAAIVAAGLAGCSHEASKVSASSSTPAPSSSETPALAPDQQLQKFAADDRLFVDGHLAEHWVVQLYSSRATPPWTTNNGVTYDSAKILQDVQQLRLQDGAKLVRSGDWAVFDSPDYWVTLAPFSFDDAASAQAWCTSHNRDADHCAAQMLSRTHH
jgi:hypothetical protein